MSEMLFNLDIIFINSTEGVVGVARNAGPSHTPTFDAGEGLGARYFLEVNAGEAEGIVVGDGADIQGDTEQAGGIDITGFITLIIMAGIFSGIAQAARKV